MNIFNGQKSNVKSFRAAIFTLLAISMILFLIITYGIVNSTLNGFTERAHTRAQVIENTINSSISDANQIMYGLVMMLTKEQIKPHNKDISVLLKNFDSKLSFYKSIPFSCFKLLDRNDMVVALTSVSDDVFVPQENNKDLDLIAKAKGSPFQLQVGGIRFSKKFKEIIIPMCLAFNDKDGNFAGILCSGLLVDKLNDKLNMDCSSENISKITLHNSKDIEYYGADNIFTITNLPTLFRYFVREQSLTAHFHPKKYNFVVEVELKLDNLVRTIVFIILLCCSYFIFFLIIGRYLCRVYGDFYRKPLYMLQGKIQALPVDKELGQGDLCVDSLLKTLDNAAERLKLSQFGVMQESQYYTAIWGHKNMLDLILTERYYDVPKKGAKINLSSLYLTQLKNMVYEEKAVVDLHALLNEVKERCHRCYGDLSIDVVVQQSDCKEFECRHAALLEAIFHVFTLIAREKDVYLEKKHIVLSGNFTDKSSFPVINIEVYLSKDLTGKLKKVDLTDGNTVLLGVYLLAKENNLFFHIEQQKQKIIFYFEPISDERLAKITRV